MAAYAALVSLSNIIHTLKNHPSPPISIDETQLLSLSEIVTSLTNSLDRKNSRVVADDNKADLLERGIADAIYAVEDAIESQIVAQIDGLPTPVENSDFYHIPQILIDKLNLIREEVDNSEDQKETEGSATLNAAMSSFTVKENVMVGFKKVSYKVLEKLTGDPSNRQIILIAGMPGIGKTTLAKELFHNETVKNHFDHHAWTTISRTFNAREALRQIFSQLKPDDVDKSYGMSEDMLGKEIRKTLLTHRYLIILDDMWDRGVWNKINRHFPEEEEVGSRIIVTTRMSNLSSELDKSDTIDMELLDKRESWNLFCNAVSGGKSCPKNLQKIGKNIVANCKGLPLSIVTIGGLLSKSEPTQKFWGDIEKKFKSKVKGVDNSCLEILRISYINLPNYLKPCFLYMGVFEEDRSICVSMLKKLWFSEGFLKPSEKCWETTAQKYIKELVDRNLILVDKLGFSGNVKYCKIHDLLREMCLIEVAKERFYHVIKDDAPASNTERRVVFPFKTSLLSISGVFGSLPNTRSIICGYRDEEEESGEDEKGGDYANDEEGVQKTSMKRGVEKTMMKDDDEEGVAEGDDGEMGGEDGDEEWSAEGDDEEKAGEDGDEEGSGEDEEDSDYDIDEEMGGEDGDEEWSGEDEEDSDYESDEEMGGEDEEDRGYDSDEEMGGEDGDEEGGTKVRLPYNHRLLRTFKAYDKYAVSDAYFLKDVLQMVNSRYLAVRVHDKSKFPASVGRLWNVHTLIIHGKGFLSAPGEIWKLHQLLHLKFVRDLEPDGGLILPDPPSGDNDSCIMKNLQTLKGVNNFYLNKEVVERIPHVKKLSVEYDKRKQRGEEDCLSHLHNLSKLENFHCSTFSGFKEYWQRCWQNVNFPESLKKLQVYVSSDQELEGILEKIGPLPLLEKFVLEGGFFKTGKWETTEGQFLSLKSLELTDIGLKNWKVSDKSHFPLLQKLRLRALFELKKIPSEVGEIATLELIHVAHCSESAVKSAEKIVKKQIKYSANEDLRVQVYVLQKHKALKDMERGNFRVNVI